MRTHADGDGRKLPIIHETSAARARVSAGGGSVTVEIPPPGSGGPHLIRLHDAEGAAMGRVQVSEEEIPALAAEITAGRRHG
jgi:hypothetical protein